MGSLYTLRLQTISYKRLFNFINGKIKISRSISTCKNDVKDNISRYTSEEQVEILNILRNCVENNITRTHLNRNRLHGLKAFFENNPKVKSLEALRSINGFGPRSLNRLCDSILKESLNEEFIDFEEKDDTVPGTHLLKLPPNIITPSHICQWPVKTIISIQLGINAISWNRLCLRETVHMDVKVNEGEVDVWDYLDLSEHAEKRFDVHSVCQLVSKLREKIPNADIYVLENYNWSNVASIKKPMKHHIQDAMMTTAICSVFNQSDCEGEMREKVENRVYFLRSFTPARLFQKIIGSEEVSAQDIVQNMFDNLPDPRHQPIRFICDTAEHYLSQNGSLRDILCRSLLLSVTFTELILLHNRTAINIITRRNNKKELLRSTV